MNLATWGKIAGAVGLLVLLSSPYTYFVTTGSAWTALAKVGAGLLLIAGYLATNWQHFGQFASRKSTYYVLFSAVTGLFLAGGLAAANYVAWKKNVRWDLTAKKIHSLAPQTVSALKALPEDGVHALVFLTPEQPEYELLDRQLERYQREAPGRFGYVFRDPAKFPDLTSKYPVRPGRPTLILIRGEGDEAPHVALHRFSEQDLTNGLLKLQSTGEQKVYFTAGHDEWPLEADETSPGSALSQLAQSLQQEGYAAEALNLAGLTDVPRDAAAIVVAGARSRLSDAEERVLTRYLAEGGRLLLFAEGQLEGGLDKLLAAHGVQLDNGMLADAQFAVNSPFNVVSIFYGEHEITDRHRRAQLSVQFPTARGLSVVREGTLEGVVATPVVLSSPYAWIETTPGPAPRPDPGEKAGQVPMVIASQRAILTGPSRRFEDARLVVFGDSELLIDVNWGMEPNRNLVMNAFAWATQQSNKVTIRPPDRDRSTLDLDPALLTRIHFTATDLLPLLLLGIGVAIWQARRSK